MRRRRRPAGWEHQSLVPLVDRLVDQRYADAAQTVAALRAERPGDDPDRLADALIRRYARELAFGGAMAGGAAASPVAGMTVAAATAGVDGAYGMARLGELIMAIGLVYGHEHAGAQERAGWVWAVLGLTEGATVGLTGLAARIGARGGARLLARLPAGSQAAVSARLSRRVLARVGSSRGPWSLAALVPYGIGAGIGAAGNALLAQSVGRAAKQFFTGGPAPLTPPPVVEEALEVEIVDDDPGAAGTAAADPTDAEVIDAEVIETEVIETEVIDTEVVETDVIDAEIVDAPGSADPGPSGGRATPPR
jgi:hypothetical protein